MPSLMEGMWRKAKRAMGIGICAHLPAVTGDRADCASEGRASDTFSQDSAAPTAAAAHASAHNTPAQAQAAGAPHHHPSRLPQVQFASSPSANRSPRRRERESPAAAPCESGEMVLAQLGGSLSRALARMTNATVVDERVLGDCLNEITRALLQADIQFDMVRDMHASVKRAVYLGAHAAGTDKRRVIKTIMSTTTRPSPLPPARTRPNLTQILSCDFGERF
ncbi:Signal recognition particle 54 kDa protein 2 [Hordeum vulgare]|nr:Signal recognition particle 54 kDa protein 2 [Hordeum vulgare]